MTTFQSTSLLYTEAPGTWHKMWNQAMRWNKGSQGTTLSSFGWMLMKSHYVAFVYLTDIITPFFLLGVVANAVHNAVIGNHEFIVLQYIPIWAQLLMAYVGMNISLLLRHTRYYARHLWEIIKLPFNVLFLLFFHSFNRIIAVFFCSTHMAWGTRGKETGFSSNVLFSRIALAILVTTLPLLVLTVPGMSPAYRVLWMGMAFCVYSVLLILIILSMPSTDKQTKLLLAQTPSQIDNQRFMPSLTWFGQITQFVPTVLGLCLCIAFIAALRIDPQAIWDFFFNIEHHVRAISSALMELELATIWRILVTMFLHLRDQVMNSILNSI